MNKLTRIWGMPVRTQSTLLELLNCLLRILIS